MKEYQNYIFDLYGTLADIHTDESSPGFWRDAAGIFAARGAIYDGPALRRAYESAVARAEARLDGPGGEIDLLPVFAALLRQGGADPGNGTAEEIARLFRRRSATRLRLYAGAEDLLDALRARGRKLYLLTNAQRVFTLPELEELGLRDRFDGILISSDTGWKKPDRRFFRALLTRFDLRAEECLMIGNDPVCDIRGARQIGIDGYWIRSALSPRTPVREDGGARYAQDGMDLRQLRRRLCRAEDGAHD